MSKNELVKRYCLFFVAITISGLSVSIIAKANLGITPIVSLSYVWSLHSTLTLGQTTFIFNIAIILLQYFFTEYAIKRFIINAFLQLPILLLFSFAIDISKIFLDVLLPTEQSYLFSLCMLIIGTICLAFGICLQLIANVAMISGEAFVNAVSKFFNKSFGTIKIIFDVSLVSSAIIVSLICTNFETIEGIREGTVFVAVSIGFIVRIMLPRLMFLKSLFKFNY